MAGGYTKEQPVMCPWDFKKVVPTQYRRLWDISCPCGYKVKLTSDELERHRMEFPVENAL